MRPDPAVSLRVFMTWMLCEITVPGNCNNQKIYTRQFTDTWVPSDQNPQVSGWKPFEKLYPEAVKRYFFNHAGLPKVNKDVRSIQHWITIFRSRWGEPRNCGAWPEFLKLSKTCKSNPVGAQNSLRLSASIGIPAAAIAILTSIIYWVYGLCVGLKTWKSFFYVRYHASKLNPI
jgi:hypothetical protein